MHIPKSIEFLEHEDEDDRISEAKEINDFIMLDDEMKESDEARRMSEADEQSRAVNFFKWTDEQKRRKMKLFACPMKMVCGGSCRNSKLGRRSGSSRPRPALRLVPGQVWGPGSPGPGAAAGGDANEDVRRTLMDANGP